MKPLKHKMVKHFDKASTMSSAESLRVDAEQSRSIKHICGQCLQKFTTLTAYLTHICKSSGHAPIEPEQSSSQTYTVYQVEPGKKKAKFSENQIIEAVSSARRSKR
ncbi:hypothetical protein A2865_01045 [Candidatus Woesebacteria bacterium RIFCSPHIGHO2_01_FULL_39_17]|nr:MAG: hypothetical protein A2865_01045 [Candidatus Woesebacteria bacterium RIFCSPHIGHO2_01_FULL_39_17]